MPWKKIEVIRSGGGCYEASICPLGKFSIDLDSGGGSYTKDPVETCLDCNFSDTSQSKLEDVCQCPTDMTWQEYDRLRKEYTQASGPHTKPGFWKFVRNNRAS